MKMKSKLTILLAFLLIAGNAFAELVRVDTPSSSLIIQADKGKKLRHLYYGTRISDADAANLKAAGAASLNAYPDYGVDPSGEPAIAVVHADGNMTLDLVVDAVSSRKEDNADVKVIDRKSVV